MPSRQTRKKLQHGGKELYISVNQITEDVIEKTFCNGKTIADLPEQPYPIFVLKWGPPGSGKSSAKMEEFIRSLGIPLNSYMNFSSDDIFETIMQFRMETALEKMKTLRAKVDYEVGDLLHLKSLLQSFVESMTRFQKYIPGDLLQRVDALQKRRVWESGRTLTVEQKTYMDQVLTEIVEAISSATYSFYKHDLRNASGFSIQEKLKRVLARAFRKKINVMYESTGWGYDTNTIGTMRNSFVHIRPKEGATTRAASKPENIIDLFKNSKERLLGKIMYNEFQEPVAIDESSLTEESVPLRYRIYVVYPIIPKREIMHRALTRALQTFTSRNSFTIPNNSSKEEYITLYKSFLTELTQIMGSTNTKGMIDELIKTESADYKDSYSSYLETLFDSAESGILSPPFFRSVSFNKIEETIEQAFQYSIDYFLKQYLVIGRIERIVYISTLGEKYTDPVPRNYVNVFI